MFGLDISFGIFFGSKAAYKQDVNDTVERRKEDSIREAGDKQRNSHQQRQREQEISADRESLDILETATAANSERAKKLDRESLEILMSLTNRMKVPGNSITTPSKSSYRVGVSPSATSNGIQSFDSPSFSTPRSSEGSYALLNRTNKAEDIFTNETTASKAATAVAKKTSWEKLTAKLVAAGWSPSSIEALRNAQMHNAKDQVDSVYEWFDELEKRDAEEECERFEASGEPIMTPVSGGSRRRCHPGGKVQCEGKEEMDNGYGEGLKSEPRMGIEKSIEDEKDAGKVEITDGEE